MNSFRYKIKEALARVDMPQVSQNELPKVYIQLTNAGVQCKYGVIECAKLKPVQEGINREKVENIKQAIADGADLGHIVISKEGYIIDGHHRWVAMKEAYSEKKKINAIQINLPKNKALKVITAMQNEQKINEIRSTVPTSFWITYFFNKQDHVEVLDIFQSEPGAKAKAKAGSTSDIMYAKIDTFLPR
jgi:uncharacterized protein (DUF1015 family)